MAVNLSDWSPDFIQFFEERLGSGLTFDAFEFAHELYRVTSRGNARQSIYGDDVDRFFFLKILNQDWIQAEGDMIRIQKSTQHRSNSRGDE
jgi:hypothetical protein